MATEYESISQSDLDLESNYMTGVEDIDIENETSKAKNKSTPEKVGSNIEEIFQTSFSVQNLLHEDFRAETTVVDLFLSVKKAKDNLDILSTSNIQLLYKINNLEKEARIIKADYRNLVKMMLELLAKMNVDYLIRNFPSHKPLDTACFLEDYRKSNDIEDEEGLKQKELETSQGGQTLECRREESETKSQTQHDDEKIGRGKKKSKNVRRRYWKRCRKCKKIESGKSRSRNTCSMSGKGREKTEGNVKCVDCFMSAFQKTLFHQLPISPEAFLGSFLGSFFRLRKEQEKTLKTLKSSKSSSPGIQNLQKEDKCDEGLGNVTLDQSTIQIISDICDTLNEAKDMPDFHLKKIKKTEKQMDLENWVSCGNRLLGRYQSPSVKDIASGERVDPKRNFSKENLTLRSVVSSSECLKRKKKPVEGDETSEAEVEGESSNEERSDFVEALTDPLTSFPEKESKFPSPTGMGDQSATVLGKRSVRTLTDDTSLMERLSDEIYKIGKVNATTNLQRARRFSDRNEIRAKYSENVQFTVPANTPLGLHDVQYKKNPFSDNIWSEDIFRNSDLKPVWTNSSSVTGEKEPEKFSEIYVKDSKKKNEKLVSSAEKKVLKKMELRTGKSHFFEIQKCFPVYLVQKMEQKTPTDVRSGFSGGNKDEKEISDCTAEEKEKKQFVVKRSSSDLIIRIQVELDEGWNQKLSKGFVENQKNSLGTQTSEGSSEDNLVLKDEVISFNESSEGGESLSQIWRYSDNSEQKGSRTFPKPFVDDEESIITEKEGLMGKDLDEKILRKEDSMTLEEDLLEMYIESEISETYPDEEEKEEEKEERTILGTAELLFMKEEKQRADVWIFQPEVKHKLNVSALQQAPGMSPEIIELINKNAMELKKALELIHEIENDIINVKLNDAILILPQLEAELRKHLQSKIRNIGERDSERDIGVDKFFSAVEFWPEEKAEEEEKKAVEEREDNAQERLNNLLKLLSNLEQAVKHNEQSSKKFETCQFGFSKIYELLHALTLHIHELEEHPNVTSVSQTLEVASLLDTAVREYDNEVNKQPLNFVSPKKKKRKSKSLEEIPVKSHLKNVRKKVFETVEEEASNLEGKIEADFDLLDSIEKQNNEAMTFLETFLQKTERRIAERASLKNELKNLSSVLNSLYEAYREALMRKKEKEMKTEKQILQVEKPTERSAPSSSKESHAASRDNSAKESVSGLFTALESLKSRAREKNEVCKEILSSSNIEKVQDSEGSFRKTLTTATTTANTDGLKSFVKECNRIGNTSLYLSWAEPEGALKDVIVGYQIYVDGKLNQKVRNPQRLQAILYSVDLTKRIQIQLYALAANHSKILLATLMYPDE